MGEAPGPGADDIPAADEVETFESGNHDVHQADAFVALEQLADTGLPAMALKVCVQISQLLTHTASRAWVRQRHRVSCFFQQYVEVELQARLQARKRPQQAFGQFQLIQRTGGDC